MCCLRYKLLKIKRRHFGDSGQNNIGCNMGMQTLSISINLLRPEIGRIPSRNLIKDESGMWLNWDFGLQAHKYKYFNDLFSSHSCDTDLVLSKVRKIFSSSHNEDLLQPFDQREVKSALFSMFGEKSLSPYSLNPGFFQHY